MAYLKRFALQALESGLQHNPVVALIGPRQCGKSTLVRHLLQSNRPILYLDLEKPSDLRKLDEAEWFFTSQKEKLICIDEVQRKPELFPIIRSMVDEWGGNGHFLVLGSASRDLLKQSSESLAGRITYKQLTPFLWEEVKVLVPYERYVTAGGFPRSLLQEDATISLQWREDFIATYLERDLLQWSGFSPQTMRRLWQMLAHNNGQTINLSIIGSSLGISHTTVRNYLDLLQETFMVYLLPPLLTNQGKRLIKTPKVYITDSGIVAGLLGLRDFNALVGHQVFGSLWEGIVLMNIKGVYPQAELFFYRTTNGAEIDIIMELGNKRFALECKASLAPTVTKGTYIALGDLAPLHTFVVAPVQEGYLLKPNMSVVSLSELFCRLSAFLAD